MASWIAVDMATGYETRLAPVLAEGMTGWTADQWGNLVRRVGSGSPRRVVACALDRPSYATSRITPDGYLRVHRIGGGSRHPLWDQAFEAQQVRILTRAGPIAGVVARSNGHFAQQHRDETAVVRADDLWVDVGAESAEDVASLGIELLDPIARHLPPWVLEDAVAGPDAGRRVGCAAVATLARAAERAPPAGETVFVLSGQEQFGWVGLSSLIARGDRFDAVTLVGPGQEPGVAEERPARSLGAFGAVLEAGGIASYTWIAPGVRGAGSHMERITLEDADDLLARVAGSVNLRLGTGIAWVGAPPPPAFLDSHLDPTLGATAGLLEGLVELYGVSGHEWQVRRHVLEALPEWARERAVVDDIGNVIVAVGPDRDTTVFMAHLDEVGYEVDSIAPDGIVTLRRQGGVVESAWEGQTALLHFDPEGAPSTATGSGDDTDPRWKRESSTAVAPPPLAGVFLGRDGADRKNPTGAARAWFGVDAAALAARGVRVGSSVTSHKEGLRLGRTRFVARGLDDRAGTTALLSAVKALDPAALERKVIFAWSVHEEGGLLGAEAMARRVAATTRRIYSVDTFVSSDTPLESPHFAYAPLGAGPVLRAIENSGVSPDRERDRVRRAARDAGIPLQIGLTQGGTDGTRFTFRGAPNQGLSWPGRYSHSPGEVLDLRDLVRLGELVLAMALWPEP